MFEKIKFILFGKMDMIQRLNDLESEIGELRKDVNFLKRELEYQKEFLEKDEDEKSQEEWAAIATHAFFNNEKPS